MAEKKLWKTNDMSLAAFLSLHAEPEDAVWDVKDNTVYWFFFETPELTALVASFSGNQAQVDPKVYSYRYAQMKKDMFAIKDGAHSQRVGHGV